MKGHQLRALAVCFTCACVLFACTSKPEIGSKTGTDAATSSPSAAETADTTALAGRPCGLLSDKTASAVLNQPMAISPDENPLAPTLCEWTTAGQAESPQAMDILVDARKPGDPQFAFYGGQLAKPSTIISDQPPVVVGDIGERAVWVPDAHACSLLLRRHGTIVRIQIMDRSLKRPAITRAQMEIIGKEVASHL